jgi:dTDP-glucose 4,6-dehydratase
MTEEPPAVPSRPRRERRTTSGQREHGGRAAESDASVAVVTGGSGFIGGALVDLLLSQGWQVINYSKRTYAYRSRVLADAKGYQLVLGDVQDSLKLHRVLLEHAPDYIFHLAAESHVDRSFDYPVEFFQANAGGTVGVLEAIRALPKDDRPLLIHMSTDEVFGTVPGDRYASEDEPLKPQNPYSAAKASAEGYVRAYRYSFGVDAIVARAMNNVGRYQHPEKLVPKICTRLLSGTPFTLFEGGSVRGWIHADDTAAALQVLAVKGRPGEVYHIPPAGYATVPEVAKILIDIAGKPDLFLGYKGRRLQDDERYALDGSKMRREMGWQPSLNLDGAFRATFEWFRDHPDYWRGSAGH